MRFRNCSAIVLFLAWAAVATWSRMALAEDAGELIRQGVELRRRGDDAGALRLFEKAHQIDRSPRALAQMGLAEQALGRWMAASEHLHRAIETDKDPWIVKNRSVLREAIKRVDEHIGWIEILGGPSGAELLVDGVSRGHLPLDRRLATTTGVVVIELLTPGRLPIQRTTNVRPGETTRESFEGFASPVAPQPPPAVKPAASDVTVAAPKEPDPKEPPPVVLPTTDAPATSGEPGPQPDATDGSTAAADSSRRWPLLLATGGLATAGLVLGVVEHVSWQNKVDSFEAMPACGESLSDRGGAACNDIYKSGQRAMILAIVGYGAGAALAATTAVLFFWRSPNTGGNDSRQVACAVSPFAPGVGCVVRF